MANEICSECGDRIYDLGGDIAERLRDLAHEAFAKAESAEIERLRLKVAETGKESDGKVRLADVYTSAFGRLEVMLEFYAKELERGCVCHINRITQARADEHDDGPDDADDDHGLDALYDRDFDKENAA